MCILQFLFPKSVFETFMNSFTKRLKHLTCLKSCSVSSHGECWRSSTVWGLRTSPWQTYETMSLCEDILPMQYGDTNTRFTPDEVTKAEMSLKSLFRVEYAWCSWVHWKLMVKHVKTRSTPKLMWYQMDSGHFPHGILPWKKPPGQIPAVHLSNDLGFPSEWPVRGHGVATEAWPLAAFVVIQ